MRSIAALAVLLALAGCGSSGTKTSSVATTTANEHPVGFDLYLLHGGKLAVVRRDVRTSKSPVQAAVEQLALGPTSAERSAGYSSAMPARVGFQATVRAGRVDVSLTSALARAALAQLTYTLSRVEPGDLLRVNGKTYAPGDFERFAPAILIESPALDQAVRSPVSVSGTANAFEATFTLELRAGGRVLARKTVHATSGSGERGSFVARFRYSVSGKTRGELRAYELSQQDGTPVNEVSVPIVLVP